MEPIEGPDVLYLAPGILDSLCRLLVLLDQASKVPAWLHPHGLSIQDLIGLALMEALEKADYRTDAWPCSFSSTAWVGRVKAVYTHTHWLQGLTWQQHKGESATRYLGPFCRCWRVFC